MTTHQYVEILIKNGGFKIGCSSHGEIVPVLHGDEILCGPCLEKYSKNPNSKYFREDLK